ncbi:hypothetical protein [Actinoplanes derwentensis]|uniref:Uncharacterized protein n=1 Tax=Actinoplanes derwentensis TaxID=113562 RepID=A0A1H2CY25_9ACTN|nr:hypothetical protein [Actinoplanes derwentensis]GID82817.1 hypothetical protein Ade03nite_17410 [Actinoplanes derwentensis]SDT75112.1 hypothetical protein SAMN04489716_7197 [Actinoplanes derwentensis]
MRGGLDDALDKLARRDELRRRATGESGGTPPAVTELVEAIAGVVSRNPQMSVTVGVEGTGDPVLLHFAMADGVVQVTADNTVASRAAEGSRHADFEIDVEEPAEEPAPAAEMPRASHDDQDRFGPTDYDYAEPTTAEQPYVQQRAHETPFGYEAAGYAERGNITPHPFAPTPPPQVPPQTQASPHPYAAAQQPPHPYAEYAEYSQQTQQQPDPEPPLLEPLKEPIPLKVERPEETEQAARRLAAMLRSDPTLLDGP